VGSKHRKEEDMWKEGFSTLKEFEKHVFVGYLTTLLISELYIIEW
jgi:hypothetical protein